MVNAYRKGHNFTAWVARSIRHIWPDAKRAIQDRGAVSDGVPDIIGTPYWIECKRYKKLSENAIQKFADKAKAEWKKVGQSDYPGGWLLIYKLDYEPVFVLDDSGEHIGFEHWLKEQEQA